MKLRYYLRGLGIGIFVTAIFFISFGSQKQTEMSDAQVRARAAKLGMIDNPVLKELETATEESMLNTEGTDEAATIDTAAEETNTTEETTTTVEEATTTPAVTTSPIEETSIAQKEQNTSTTVTISVHSGDGSGTVSQRVFEAGLVTNAHEFDKYLMQNGYDKKITPGEHEISTDASVEEIAKSLCKSIK